MNTGAAAATANILLFLHADSAFDANDTLERGVSALKTQLEVSGSAAVAGRFALRFRRPEPSPAYFFYEAKARLDRSDCIRGDQGIMLSRAFFRRLGGFEEQMPYLEDLRFVSAVRAQGTWMLLPADIATSARRFETEGLFERQVVNAIIVNSFVTGWSEFFSSLGGVYRSSPGSGRLALFPILDGIRELLARRSPVWRRAFWRATGRHVAVNAWQLFFWLDARRAFSGGRGPGEVEARCLHRYERGLAKLFCTLPAAIAAELCVKLWFRFMLVRHRPSQCPEAGYPDRPRP